MQSALIIQTYSSLRQSTIAIAQLSVLRNVKAIRQSAVRHYLSTFFGMQHERCWESMPGAGAKLVSIILTPLTLQAFDITKQVILS